MATLSPTKKRARACQAADPSTCRVHGHPAETVSAETFMKEYKAEHTAGTLTQATGDTSATAQPVNTAITSTLNWDGQKPDWWENYADEAAHHRWLPTEPELLDVISTPAGPVAVVWQEQSHRRGDIELPLESGMGVKTCEYRSMETGETLGYLKMTYVDDSTFAQSFGDDEFTAFRYMERHDSGNFGFMDYNAPVDEYGYDLGPYDEQALTEKRRKIWSSSNPYDDQLPDDDTVKVDLERIKEQQKEKINNFRNYFATPYIDYSKVEEPLRGKGYGAALYVYSARKLAQEGKVLRGSGIQTEEAQSLWGKFKKKVPNNVKAITLKSTHENENIDYHVLDFTD